MSKHVAVLMGGWSAEREISLRSGKACAEALARLGHRVTRIDVGRDFATVLTTVKPDVALNMLHPRPGEDGTLQGVLEILAIPYTHSGVMASAVAMQKDIAKSLFRAAEVPVPEGLVVSRLAAAKAHLLPRPYVIKPLAEGSSVGVFIVREDHAHPPQELTREDWAYGELVLVEKYIAGKELTCAVMGDAVLGVIEIVPMVKFYDYEAKYAPGGSKHLLPAPVSSFVYQQVRRLALAAHRALGCRGVSRADFRYDGRIEGTGGLVCLEVNTQPGMTETSLVPELAAHAGITFDELVQWMIADASLNRCGGSRDCARACPLVYLGAAPRMLKRCGRCRGSHAIWTAGPLFSRASGRAGWELPSAASSFSRALATAQSEGITFRTSSQACGTRAMASPTRPAFVSYLLRSAAIIMSAGRKCSPLRASPAPRRCRFSTSSKFASTSRRIRGSQTPRCSSSIQANCRSASRNARRSRCGKRTGAYRSSPMMALYSSLMSRPLWSGCHLS